MPSITARKSSLRSAEVAHRLRQRAQFRRRPAGIDRFDVVCATPQALAAARHAARSNPRRHRPAGRTNRFRTSPRAARAAKSASRCRTSCPRRGSARRSFAVQRVWRRSSAGDLLTAPGARPRRPNNPFAAPSAPNAATPSLPRRTFSLSGSRLRSRSHEMPRQRDDGGDLQRQPRSLICAGSAAALFQHGAGALGKPMQAGEQLRASRAARPAPRRSRPPP